MNEKLADALDEVRPVFIDEAARRKRVKKKPLLRGIAAVAAAVLLVAVILNFPYISLPVSADTVSLADYSAPDSHDYEAAREYTKELSTLFGGTLTQVLSNSGEENVAFSPINLYYALAITAEMTGGDSELLELLAVDDLTALRQQAATLWAASYRDNNNQCLLASSLWLDEALTFNQSVMDTLAQRYYTSVYSGDLGSKKINTAISRWLNNQTGGLLKDSADGIKLSEDTPFAIYSTVYYQAKWSSAFKESANTKDIFHAPGGDITVTYMNASRRNSTYYWAENFSAVNLYLKDSSRMLLILPDEGFTLDDVLANPQLTELLQSGSYENSKEMMVNLSLPKFDIRSSGDLSDSLKAMGVTGIFDGSADFSAAVTSDTPLWLDAVNQTTRVCIDEEGVTAASYIEIPGAGSAEPPDEIIDFILDRPFLFVVLNHSSIPLFAGVVNQP